MTFRWYGSQLFNLGNRAMTFPTKTDPVNHSSRRSRSLHRSSSYTPFHPYKAEKAHPRVADPGFYRPFGKAEPMIRSERVLLPHLTNQCNYESRLFSLLMTRNISKPFRIKERNKSQVARSDPSSLPISTGSDASAAHMDQWQCIMLAEADVNYLLSNHIALNTNVLNLGADGIQYLIASSMQQVSPSQSKILNWCTSGIN